MQWAFQSLHKLPFLLKWTVGLRRLVTLISIEAVVRSCSVKQAFLKILHNSQENTCARVSFLIKLRRWHRCFPVNFAKFLRTPFLQNTSGRLLLIMKHSVQFYCSRNLVTWSQLVTKSIYS